MGGIGDQGLDGDGSDGGRLGMGNALIIGQ